MTSIPRMVVCQGGSGKEVTRDGRSDLEVVNEEEEKSDRVKVERVLERWRDKIWYSF